MAESENHRSPSPDEELENGRSSASLERHIYAAGTVRTNPDIPAQTPSIDNPNSTHGLDTLSISNPPSFNYPYQDGVQQNHLYFAPTHARGYNDAVYSDQVPFHNNNTPANIFHAPYSNQPSSTYNIPRGDRGRLAGRGRLPGRRQRGYSRGGYDYAPQCVNESLAAEHYQHPPYGNQRTLNDMGPSPPMNMIVPPQQAFTSPIPRGQLPGGMNSDPLTP
jgi:hypothetical protein